MKLLLTALIASLVELSTQEINYCSASLCRTQGGGPHIACKGFKKLAPSCGPGAQEISLGSSKQALITNLHNELRSKVALGKQENSRRVLLPEAARMATLQWDSELASIAAANSRRCVYGHDKCRNTARFPSVGQNIAQKSLRGGRKSVEMLLAEFVDEWYSEYKGVSPNQLAKLPGGTGIGHFTQMVLDRATRIGCSLVTYKDGRWDRWNFVCNYSVGNVRNQPVYKAGKACSKCAAGCNKAYPGLCNKNEVFTA